jgi:hypothetical protein
LKYTIGSTLKAEKKIKTAFAIKEEKPQELPTPRVLNKCHPSTKRLI